MVERRTITVEGMNCTGCEQKVTNALTTIDGVRRAEADHDTGEVEVVVDDETETDVLTDVIYDTGYDVPT
jgi:copper chaperone CopZ